MDVVYLVTWLYMKYGTIKNIDVRVAQIIFDK